MRDIIEEIRRLADKRHIYIYGAGMYGGNVYDILNRADINVEGFIITSGRTDTAFRGKKLFLADEVIGRDIAIILAMSARSRDEVISYLKQEGFDPKYICDGSRLIDSGIERFGADGRLHVDMTLRIGCSVACRYCPQQKLTSAYFKDKSDREYEMSIDTFKRVLSHLPGDSEICFAGMAEPFLNPHCVEMLEMVCDSSHRVLLYTTLMGIKEEQIDRILKLSIDFICLHVADKGGYAHIKVDETYLKMVNKVIRAKKNNGKPFVDMINAQGEADGRVAAILENRVVLTALEDRGGNIEGEEVIHARHPDGTLVCAIGGDDFKVVEIMPDGTAILCCMDYGMKHILGNIAAEDYGAIRAGDEMRRILRGVRGDASEEILCRYCTAAHVANGKV